jgi:hypothetical protein
LFIIYRLSRSRLIPIGVAIFLSHQPIEVRGQDWNVFENPEDSIPLADTSNALAAPKAHYGSEQIDSILNNLGYDSTLYFKKSDKLRTEIFKLIQRGSSTESAFDSIQQVKTDGFERYSGMIIRNIEFRQLDIFGQSIQDTSQKAENWNEKLGNSLHINTQEKVLRNRLLISSGDTINPLILTDNERLIRELPFIDDAIIYINEVSPDSVDISFYTKDVFSLGAGFELFDVKYGRAGIWNKNLLGVGHELYYYLSWNYNENQKYGHRIGYHIQNIGNTFITANTEYINQWRLESFKIYLNRDFITPQTKYAGGAGYEWIREIRNVEFPDTVFTDQLLNYNLQDFWFGRSYMFSSSQNEKTRRNIALTGRITRYQFQSRPEVDVTILSEFHDRTTFLASAGLTNQHFRKSKLIYGFGRSEDIPLGSMLTVTSGIEMNEYLNRPYLGFNYSLAGEWLDIGYLYQQLEVGGFINEGIEQGEISYNLKYFTPLMNSIGRYNYRLFAAAKYRIGLNRFEDEFLQFSKNDDIRGLTSINLRGNQLMSINLESVCYSPHKPLGFRFVYFLFIDAGLITNRNKVLIKNPVYTGFGAGLRFKNENLVFTTIQMRLSYYPLIPDNTSPEYLQFNGVPDHRFDNFIIPRPEILEYK